VRLDGGRVRGNNGSKQSASCPEGGVFLVVRSAKVALV
jgi:hypothetical protein